MTNFVRQVRLQAESLGVPLDKQHSAHPTIAAPTNTNGGNQSSQNSDGRKDRSCIEPCGKNHQWGFCKYLNWEGLGVPKPDDDTMTEVEKLREENSRLDKAITESVKKFNRWYKKRASKTTTNKPESTNETKPKEQVVSITQRGKGHTQTSTTIVHSTITTNQDGKSIWILDTGATCHVSNDRSLFTEFREVNDTIRQGSVVSYAAGIGPVNLTVKTPKGPVQLTLKEVLYAPSFRLNILSYSTMHRHGLSLEISNKKASLLTQNKKVEMLLYLEEGLWSLDLEKDNENQVLITKKLEKKPSKASVETWHQRLGHLNDADMKNVPQNVEGVEFTGTDTNPLREQLLHSTTSIKPKEGADPQICSTCASAKITQAISRTPRRDTGRLFSVLAIDLLTPTRDTSYSGAQALLHVYDTNSGYRIGKAVRGRDKQDIMLGLIHIINGIKNQHGLTPQYFILDGEERSKAISSPHISHSRESKYWQQHPISMSKEDPQSDQVEQSQNMDGPSCSNRACHTLSGQN